VRRRAAAAALLLTFACQKTVADEPLLESVVVPARAPSARGPALVLLHGLGSNERDLLSLAAAVDPRFTVYSLRAPLPLGPDAWSWFPVRFTDQGPVHDVAQAEHSRRRLVQFLEHLRAQPNVDPARVYLLGFSQGAILSLSVALTRPELIAGAVVLSGRTLPEVAAQAHASSTPPRVLLLHGLRDGVLPWANAPASQQALRAVGIEPLLKSYDADHEVNAEMRADLVAWLAAQLDKP
jgi:phospholipase/carboxylesterase